MRLPFKLDNSDFGQDARVKFIYTSPELHQNIEISIDGDDTTVDALLESFHRFLGALGICTPSNVILGFIEMDEDDEDSDDKDEKND